MDSALQDVKQTNSSSTFEQFSQAEDTNLFYTDDTKMNMMPGRVVRRKKASSGKSSTVASHRNSFPTFKNSSKVMKRIDQELSATESADTDSSSEKLEGIITE